MPPRTVKQAGLGIKKSAKKKKARGSGVAKNAKRDSILRTLRRAARSAQKNTRRPHQLERHENNPIIEPREDRFWEMKATFNPGAVYADRRVHLLYRAIGGDDISVLGYASSDDGMHIIERLEEPAFVPIIKKRSAVEPTTHNQLSITSSGGGWNGSCRGPPP